MEYIDSTQCFNNYLNNKISRETVIYDIILIYYFLSVIFAHKSFKSNIKQFLLGINEHIDLPSNNLTPKEKFDSLINVLNFGMKILYLTIYEIIIFSNESNIVDLIKYTLYLSIRFELTS